jgi:hypothetical protein
MIMLGRT